MSISASKTVYRAWNRIKANHPHAARYSPLLAANTSMDFGVLLLRLGVAVMMLVHGIPKLGMLISGNWSAFQDPLGIGNFLSLLLCVGAGSVAPSSFCLGS